MISIHPAQPWHCGAMVRRMRDAQVNLAIMLGRDAHADLRQCQALSGFSRSWMDDGKIMAMMGVIGPLLATDGVVWLVIAKEATQHPLLIAREAQRTLQFIMTIKHRLYASPSSEDPRSVRFAEWLGFLRLPIDEEAKKVSAVPMVLSCDMQAYVGSVMRPN